MGYFCTIVNYFFIILLQLQHPLTAHGLALKLFYELYLTLLNISLKLTAVVHTKAPYKTQPRFDSDEGRPYPHDIHNIFIMHVHAALYMLCFKSLLIWLP